MKEKIEFNLISNAIDSIDHTVELIAYSPGLDESIACKRALQSISHAIELLLKERLRQIHPSLIWENVDRFPDLDSRTVTTEKALVRLERIGGLKFSAKEQNLLRSIRKIRNSIEHYKWSISSEEAQYLIGSSLSFAVSFLKHHLGDDIMGYAERDGGVLQDLIDRNKGFAETFERKLQQEYEAQNSYTCSFCKTLLKEEDSGACPKCGHWNQFGYKHAIFNFEDIDDVPF